MSQRKCTECKTSLKKSDKFCSACGEEQPQGIVLEDKKPEKVPFHMPEYLKPWQRVTSPRDCYESERIFTQRVVHCKNLFQKLNDGGKELIKAARLDGLYWRGEPIEQFQLLYDEHMRQKEMTKSERLDYRRNIMTFVRAARKAQKREAA